ncbi:MAG TPA: glucosidase, partial [Acetobacteraceae bacterium]|nr:glucosidase [Acetobacteraceae bacterium]
AYFEVVVTYAKADTDDILMLVTAVNCGRAAANLHILPQFWARNIWSWSPGHERARIRHATAGVLLATAPGLADLQLDADAADTPLFCENETNTPLLFGAAATGPFKDGVNDAVVHGKSQAISDREGSKVALHRVVTLAPGGSSTMRLRLRPASMAAAPAFNDFDAILSRRAAEADEFHAATHDPSLDTEGRTIQRRALAGMLWSKQFYHLDVPRWLAGDPTQPAPPPTRTRNRQWRHLNNDDVIAMSDKWEYPWYAAWDLAFHCVVLARVDPEFAKAQLILLCHDWYMHPNGQMPAYEWEFSDVNPPVHAWAAWQVFQTDKTLRGQPDCDFLERIFHKLLLNFTWWVNRKDQDGRNVFQGGFLGLDNIAIFNRSKPLPTGGTIDQADGTAWMAMFCLDMMRIAIELAMTNPAYQDMASKFFEHFLAIAAAMDDIGAKGTGLWDESTGFFYDVLSLPDGRHLPLQLRSVVGLIPMFAVQVLEPEIFEKLPEFAKRTRWFLRHRPALAGLVSRWTEPGKGDRNLLSMLRGHRLTCLLRRMLDEAEFYSDYGVRSLSKTHEKPYMLDLDGQHFEIRYEPAEARGSLYGGNSNWRGPIWFPINFMIIQSLRNFHTYYGDDFRVECPVGSGIMLSLVEVADHLTDRLTRIFRRDASGHRPFCGEGVGACTESEDLLFHEYFDGDTGKGLGASHQTGWTGLIACLLAPRPLGGPR